MATAIKNAPDTAITSEDASKITKGGWSKSCHTAEVCPGVSAFQRGLPDGRSRRAAWPNLRATPVWRSTTGPPQMIGTLLRETVNPR
jgi:hypothetical protein